ECSYLIPPGPQGECSYLIPPDLLATYNEQADSITQNESLYLILSDQLYNEMPETEQSENSTLASYDKLMLSAIVYNKLDITSPPLLDPPIEQLEPQ
ncbi:7484_t:CDS:2, partial [Cetraspora pellucida]